MLAGTTNLRRLDQVEHFWDTVDTIGEGFGFSLFGARHLVTLALYIGFAALSCKLYKAADEKKRAQLRGLFAVLLLADEAFKQIGLQIGGNFNWDYLPLHLCSINIFLIALYAWKPSRLLDNFLYFICIPAATAALLFPTWTSLPAANFMFWHSTSVHILLAAYPIMLFSGGDIRPSVRYMGKCFLLLLAMAVPIYCVNLLLDAFDGRIARTKKDRTEQEKRFGIQIDSLNDLVCFGVLPAAIGWSMDCDRLWFLATMSFFALCALIRLAYFNVTEEERQGRTSENRAYYLGVPVTASAVLAPLFYLLSLRFALNCAVVYALGLFLLGVLYITPLHVKKPQLRGVAFLSVFGLGEFAVLLRVLTR